MIRNPDHEHDDRMCRADDEALFAAAEARRAELDEIERNSCEAIDRISEAVIAMNFIRRGA